MFYLVYFKVNIIVHVVLNTHLIHRMEKFNRIIVGDARFELGTSHTGAIYSYFAALGP